MGNFWRLSAVLVAMAWASSVGAQVGPGPGGGSGSSGAVYGPTAAGTAAANPPVIIGGTVDGTATGAVDNLKVSGGLAFINCANCSGSGASAADEAAYVAGTSLFAPSGGFFQTTATTGPLTTGQQGLVQMTAYRAFMTNVRNSSGAELGLTAAPFIVAGAGVAGTPAGGVMSIQGVASGTVVPVSGTVAFSNSTIAVTNAGTFAVQLTGATNNINNISGTVSLPTGAATSANQTSQITQETASAAALGTTADATCGTATGTCSLIALQKFANNTNPVLAAGSSVIGFTSNDPCSQATKLGAPVNLTASGQVITGTSAKKTYICSIDIVSATAQNIALVEGTGTVCATNIFGLAGGTTAATGWNLVANGGLTKGAGVGTVYSPSADTNAAAANVCLLLSGTGQTSGQITYVQQ